MYCRMIFLISLVVSPLLVLVPWIPYSSWKLSAEYSGNPLLPYVFFTSERFVVLFLGDHRCIFENHFFHPVNILPGNLTTLHRKIHIRFPRISNDLDHFNLGIPRFFHYYKLRFSRNFSLFFCSIDETLTFEDHIHRSC